MNAQPYIIRTTRLSVLPPNDPIFSEKCTHVSIEDHAAGEFLEIKQLSMSEDVKTQTISISQEEWPALKQAIDTLMQEITTNDI